MSFITNTSSKFIPFSLTLSNSTKPTGIAHIPAIDDYALESSASTAEHAQATTTTSTQRTQHPRSQPQQPSPLSHSTALATLIPARFSPPIIDHLVPRRSLVPPAHLSSPVEGVRRAKCLHRRRGDMPFNGRPRRDSRRGLYARDPSHSYRLAGLILSGLGTRFVVHGKAPSSDSSVAPSSKIYFPFAVKQDLMFSEAAWQCVDPALVPLLETQSTHIILEEHVDLWTQWVTYRNRYSEEINMPFLYVVGERDWLWDAMKETLAEFIALFPKSLRVDGSLVQDAPHALEWSRAGQCWYARCFGFALEVCVSQAIREGLE